MFTKHKVLLVPLIVPLEGREGGEAVQISSFAQTGTSFDLLIGSAVNNEYLDPQEE